MKNTTFFLFIITISCWLSSNVLAQDTTPKYHLNEINNLDSLSKVYFEIGDEQFLIIDAYKDGLAKSNDDMRFAYENNVLSFNNSLMSQPYASKYLAKLQRFWTKEQRTAPSRLLLGPGDGVIGEEAFVYPAHNMIKAFETPLKVILPADYAQHENYSSLLIHMLVANRIISREATELYIRYNAKELYINNEKITNGNIIASCNTYLGYIQGHVNYGSTDFFAVRYDKKEIARYMGDASEK